MIDHALTKMIERSTMISIFISAFNEEKYIKNTVADCLEVLNQTGISEFEMIIVNDGSTDKTQDIIDELSITYLFIVPINNGANRGLGYSFKQALKIAKYPKFFYLGGDNDMTVPLLKSLLNNMAKADLTFVYFLNKEMRGRKRNLLSTIYGSIYMITFGIFVQYINGGIIYNTDNLRKLELFSDRFSIIIEASLKSMCSGCTYYEVGGYMKRGLEGSTSFSLKNLFEVVISYLRLCYIVKIKRQFTLKPKRIY